MEDGCKGQVQMEDGWKGKVEMGDGRWMEEKVKKWGGEGFI